MTKCFENGVHIRMTILNCSIIPEPIHSWNRK